MGKKIKKILNMQFCIFNVYKYGEKVKYILPDNFDDYCIFEKWCRKHFDDGDELPFLVNGKRGYYMHGDIDFAFEMYTEKTYTSCKPVILKYAELEDDYDDFYPQTEDDSFKTRIADKAENVCEKVFEVTNGIMETFNLYDDLKNIFQMGKKK